MAREKPRQVAGGTCADIDAVSGDEREYASRPCPPQLPLASEAPALFTVTPAMLASAGAYTIAVVAHDAAGNPGTLLSHTVFVTSALLDGPAPPSRYDAARNLFFKPRCQLRGGRAQRPQRPAHDGDPDVRRAQSHARQEQAAARHAPDPRRTVRYSSTARVRGRVTTPTGAPIVQARVYRATSVASSPWKLATKPLITSKTGRVSFAVPARSPSRRVQLVYFPNTAANDSSRSPARLTKVRAPCRSAPTGAACPAAAASPSPPACALGSAREPVSWVWCRFA